MIGKFPFSFFLSFLLASFSSTLYCTIMKYLAYYNIIHPSSIHSHAILYFYDSIGGCDGCVNMLDLDNAGLDIPIEALNPIVNTYESEAGLSRADIWALAAITGSNFAHPDSDSFFVLNEIGRENCAENDPTRGPSRDFPSPNLETDDLLDFFADTFDFDEQETCAIMGAHTIGRVHQENSGFIGNRGWSNNRRRLDNDYYRQIVGGGDTLDDFFDAPNWDQDEIVNGGDIPTRYVFLIFI